MLYRSGIYRVWARRARSYVRLYTDVRAKHGIVDDDTDRYIEDAIAEVRAELPLTLRKIGGQIHMPDDGHVASYYQLSKVNPNTGVILPNAYGHVGVLTEDGRPFEPDGIDDDYNEDQKRILLGMWVAQEALGILVAARSI
jgi:hypothetical protein